MTPCALDTTAPLVLPKVLCFNIHVSPHGPFGLRCKTPLPQYTSNNYMYAGQSNTT